MCSLRENIHEIVTVHSVHSNVHEVEKNKENVKST